MHRCSFGYQKHGICFIPLHLQSEPDVVPQTDLVPTLALLLGIPIPYSSVGQVLLPLFPLQEQTERAVGGLGQLEALWINAKQVVCVWSKNKVNQHCFHFPL